MKAKNSKAKNGNASDPIRLFATQTAWAAWLEKNHRNSQGLWLRLAKKGSGLRSVTHSQALEVALGYGWIDGQKRGESEQAWLERFLPRSGKSIWSKINRNKATALITSGRMKVTGLEAVEAARQAGRWDATYDSPKGALVPADFKMALDTNPRAREFFDALDGANRYALLFRIQTVNEDGDPGPQDSRVCRDAGEERDNSPAAEKAPHVGVSRSIGLPD